MKSKFMLTALMVLGSGGWGCVGEECPPPISGDGPDNTPPQSLGRIDIEDVGSFDFIPQEVATTRPELFKPGYFSIFDLLVHLADRGEFHLEYRLDKSLDTHTIDALEGHPHWWYDVFYDGGWSEASNHRMDYYPVKDKTRIALFKTDLDSTEKREALWRTEVDRRNRNGGDTVIPEVSLRKAADTLTFTHVTVSAYNTRSDVLQNGVITALDVIQSLGDTNDISYEIIWYEEIGGFEVKNFFVDRIQDWQASGRCGFVYELGEHAQTRGNHIHLPADLRILHSPEYVLFFWIELGSC